MVYTWTMYRGGTQESSLQSTSRTASRYQLAAYSLTSGQIYTLSLNVSVVQSGQILSSSIATQTVKVLDGAVVAKIAGGSTRQLPADCNLTLNAATSYDENTAASVSNSTLRYVWGCRVVSFAQFGVNCTDVNNGVISYSGAEVTVFGSGLNSSLAYEISLVVYAQDGRSSEAVAVSIQSAPENSPLTQMTTQQVIFSNHDNFSIASAIQNSADTLSWWEILIDGSNQSVNLQSNSKREFCASFVSKSVPMSVVVQQYAFVAGSTVTFRLYAQSNTDSSSISRRLQASQSLVSFSEISVAVNGPPEGGTLASVPSSGDALTTKFVISTSGWVDTNPADYPLRYAFKYHNSLQACPVMTML